MSGTYPRNTEPMRASSRCGDRTRNGAPCQTPGVTGKARCRMHGGAAGSGAPKGNRKALKHGQYTAEARAFQAHVREVLRRGREGLGEG